MAEISERYADKIPTIEVTNEMTCWWDSYITEFYNDPDCVAEINALGGKLPDAVGIPEEQLRKAAQMAVCKINIDSDIRLAMTAGIRRVFSAKPEAFDPREYLKVAREEVKKMVSHKTLAFLAPRAHFNSNSQIQLEFHKGRERAFSPFCISFSYQNITTKSVLQENKKHHFVANM